MDSEQTHVGVHPHHNTRVCTGAPGCCSADGRKQKHFRWGRAKQGARAHTTAPRTGGHLVNASVIWGMVLVNGSPSPCSPHQGSSKTGWVTGRLAVSRVARRLVARVCDFGELGELAGYHGTTSVTMVTRNLVPAYPHWWLFRKMVPAMQGHQVLGVVPR